MKKCVCFLFILLIAVLSVGTAVRTVLAFPDALAESGGGIPGLILTAYGSLQEDKLCTHTLGHDNWIDLYGLAQKAAGVDVIPDGDRSVYRLRNGSLSFLQSCKPEFTVEELDAIHRIKSAADLVGAQSVFVGVPRKVCTYAQNVFAARGIDDPLVALTPLYESAFSETDFRMLDLHARMHDAGMEHTAAYFRTDHHWKTSTAFWAAQEIAAELGARDLPDLSQYETKTYTRFLLGSEGKHCGRLYCTPDDLDVYVPNFGTDFSVTYYGDLPPRSGDFNNTLLYWPSIERQMSPYDNNPYTVFTRGDTSQSIINHLCPDGKHITFIKDSYADSMAPYLAPAFRRIDLLDPRDFTDSLSDYIERERPDYVCVMLSPCMGQNYFK